MVKQIDKNEARLRRHRRVRNKISGTANDIAPLLRSTQIKAVFLNGQTAQKLFRKYLSEETAKFGCTVTALPSTSPANASYSLEKLAAEWGSAIRAVLVI